MGTELMRVCIKEDNEDFPSVPPGFESFTSFNLKRVNDVEKQDSSEALECASEQQPMKMESSVDVNDVAKSTRALRRKPGTNYGRHDGAEDECESERSNQVGDLFLF
jgi:hypothetical protein